MSIGDGDGVGKWERFRFRSGMPETLLFFFLVKIVQAKGVRLMDLSLFLLFFACAFVVVPVRT